jgi:hypothetical protein
MESEPVRSVHIPWGARGFAGSALSIRIEVSVVFLRGRTRETAPIR